MKPFNLEAALRGEPVVTRDGQEVTDLKYFPNVEGNYSLAGVADRQLLTWHKDGRYISMLVMERDLFMKGKTRKLTVAASQYDPLLPVNQLNSSTERKRILSATVNEDGSVTVEVEE